MKYYAMQVKTRAEEHFINLINALYPAAELRIHFPRRIVLERRQGMEKSERKTAAIFPGYIFAEINDGDDFIRMIPMFRRMEGFYRFLPSNVHILPLSGNDLEIVLHFIKNSDSVAGVSRVYFNDEDRIVVVEGPLNGLEGNIIKVDKRKGRAKIKLDLYGAAFAFDLAFVTLERQG
ncbi:MAG: antiterminator LoaP [Spirochaetaceae bacterium]|jgi:transcriptional antiterminator NusG|nr:antiterminator LoaP [Spirochaetaceae bacterium]